MSTNSIRQQIGLVPVTESVLEKDPRTGLKKDVISQPYQRWMQSARVNINDLNQRQTPSITLNPDFNWSRTNGTTPVTQADGNDASFVEQWFVFGATGNTYTITPTPYAPTQENLTGSSYFINFHVTSLTEQLYVYNVNYNPDFSMSQKMLNKPLTCSIVGTNNGTGTILVNFEIAIEGAAENIQSQGLFIPPGEFSLSTTISRQTMNWDTLVTNAYAQIQLHIEDLGATSANFDINYIKTEISELGTNLEVNHIEQKILIDNL